MEKVHVFIDCSSLWNKGIFRVGKLERIGTFDKERKNYILEQLSFDHGRLLKTVLDGRVLGGFPILAGYPIPSSDSIWTEYGQGSFVNTNEEGNAKKFLRNHAMETISKETPGMLVLVAGDCNYESVVNKAVSAGWSVEMWSWNFGTPKSLSSKAQFRSLDTCYKMFAFAYGSIPSGNMKVFEASKDETGQEWNDYDLIDIHESLDLFGWWVRCEDTKNLYMCFREKKQMMAIREWLETNQQDVTVWDVKS